MTRLTSAQIDSLLKEAEESFPHGACLTCECFLGYVAQLRVDAETGCRDLFDPYKVERGSIHGCLGCDPCPPGDLYAAHQRKKQGMVDKIDG
jgi:hypothetical protein